MKKPNEVTAFTNAEKAEAQRMEDIIDERLCMDVNRKRLSEGDAAVVILDYPIGFVLTTVLNRYRLYWDIERSVPSAFNRDLSTPMHDLLKMPGQIWVFTPKENTEPDQFH